MANLVKLTNVTVFFTYFTTFYLLAFEYIVMRKIYVCRKIQMAKKIQDAIRIQNEKYFF